MISRVDSQAIEALADVLAQVGFLPAEQCSLEYRRSAAQFILARMGSEKGYIMMSTRRMGR